MKHNSSLFKLNSQSANYSKVDRMFGDIQPIEEGFMWTDDSSSRLESESPLRAFDSPRTPRPNFTYLGTPSPPGAARGLLLPTPTSIYREQPVTTDFLPALHPNVEPPTLIPPALYPAPTEVPAGPVLIGRRRRRGARRDTPYRRSENEIQVQL